MHVPEEFLTLERGVPRNYTEMDVEMSNQTAKQNNDKGREAESKVLFSFLWKIKSKWGQSSSLSLVCYLTCLLGCFGHACTLNIFISLDKIIIRTNLGGVCNSILLCFMLKFVCWTTLFPKFRRCRLGQKHLKVA